MIKKLFSFKNNQIKETIEDLEVRKINYFIKNEDIPRNEIKSFENVFYNENDIIYNHDIYLFIKYLAEKLFLNNIIYITLTEKYNLSVFYSYFKIFRISSINYKNKFIKWINFNFENPRFINIEPKILKKSIIFCIDILEFCNEPVIFLKNLKNFLNYAPIAVLITSDRDELYKSQKKDFFNSSYKYLWNINEIKNLLEFYGFNILFIGYAIDNINDLQKNRLIIILGNNYLPKLKEAPDNFSVIAIITSYNEEDIIIPSLNYLINQGIKIYLIDNWSNDNTYNYAKNFLNKGLIGLELFPQNGPSKYYNWKDLLNRVEYLSSLLKADWFIHQDVDEIRESPWINVKLKDAIYYVDECGFNAIDHTVITFHPTDNNFKLGYDFNDYFKYFDFGKRGGHFLQIKAWKKVNNKISLAESGGHEIIFKDRKVFPFKFLLKHYPIRSQFQGEKKIYIDRIPRWNPEEKKIGWHIQYDHIGKNYSFLKKPEDLLFFNKEEFYKKYLIERLSGIGIIREGEIYEK